MTLDRVLGHNGVSYDIRLCSRTQEVECVSYDVILCSRIQGVEGFQICRNPVF